MATTTVQPKSKDRVLATAHQIVKSLNINTQATEDMINIFSRFDNRLSNITDLIQNDAKFNDQFQKAEKIILHHDSDASPEQEQSSDYLAAVDLLIQLTENLTVESYSFGDVIDRAENALQLAMSKLEDDFRHALIHNTVPLDADRLYGSVRSVSRPNLSNNSEIEGEIEDEIEDELNRFVEDEQEGSTLHPWGLITLVKSGTLVNQNPVRFSSLAVNSLVANGGTNIAEGLRIWWMVVAMGKMAVKGGEGMAEWYGGERRRG